MTSRPLCFQMMVGGRELTTSHTITASSPSLNSCGVGAFLNMSFSEKGGKRRVRENSGSPTKTPFHWCLSAWIRVHICSGTQRGPPITWPNMQSGWHKRNMFIHVWWLMSIQSAKFITLCGKGSAEEEVCLYHVDGATATQRAGGTSTLP